LGKAPPAAIEASAEAQRVLGELARRDLQLTAARNHFEAAVRAGGAVPINEIPLGLVLLRSRLPAERGQGLQLLNKWTKDKTWGAIALRILVEDALEHDDRPALLQAAESLRAHPRVTVGDMPAWLLGLSRADSSRYEAALAQLEKDHAVSPEAAAQLLGWLNKIGRHADAVAWLRTLPPAAMQVPPLAPLAAEAFRGHGDWADLQAWTAGGNWGPETEFLRWTYGLLAARQLHDAARSDELWRTLYSHGQLNTGHALFAASSLYAWGQPADAEALWWRAAEQDGRNAIEALGALARHYQVQRDADGLYRAFRRLHLLQPAEPDIANNFAFYALLVGREQRIAEQVAEQINRYHPANDAYLATRAFALTQQGRFEAAMALLQAKASRAPNSSSLSFAYGLALAGAGRKNEARALLEKLPPTSLTTAEVELIKRSLGD
jgi:tetratricopeptide (TPR) repeat protein